MIYSIIRKPGPIQLPTGTIGGGGVGSGSGTGSSAGTCTTYPCPDVLVPGYNNAGNDGGRALPVPGAAVTTTPAAQVGTGMDVEPKTSVLQELATLIVPGFVFAVLVLIIFLSSKKS